MQPPRPCLNRAARSLTTGRTQTLGLIVPDLRNPFFAEIAKGTQGRARNTGHAVFIADTDIDLTLEAHALTAMRGEVEGVVLCSPRSSDELLISQLDGLPAVLLHRHIPGLPAVVADFVARIGFGVVDGAGGGNPIKPGQGYGPSIALFALGVGLAACWWIVRGRDPFPTLSTRRSYAVPIPMK